MYIPKSKVKENQFTLGKQYVLASTNEDYIGYYYTLYTGQSFTGKTHNDKNSQLLRKLKPGEVISKIIPTLTEIGTAAYGLLKPQTKFEPIPVFYPKPTEQDYKQGYITRYFSKRKNGGTTTIQEININEYNDIYNHLGKHDYNLYGVLRIHWVISGNVEDDFSDKNFPKPGIKTQNKKVLETAEQTMSGLSKYLTDLTEFSKSK